MTTKILGVKTVSLEYSLFGHHLQLSLREETIDQFVTNKLALQIAILRSATYLANFWRCDQKIP